MRSDDRLEHRQIAGVRKYSGCAKRVVAKSPVAA